MLEELFVQLLGLIGFILLFSSYRMKNINKIVFIHMFSGVFYVIHYYLLGAYSALYVVLIESIRDSLYYFTDKDKYIFMGTIPFYLVNAVLTFGGIKDLLPIISSVVDGLGLSMKRNTAVVGGLVASCMWVIYDFSYHSYTGAIGSIILIISNIMILIKSRFNK